MALILTEYLNPPLPGELELGHLKRITALRHNSTKCLHFDLVVISEYLPIVSQMKLLIIHIY